MWCGFRGGSARLADPTDVPLGKWHLLGAAGGSARWLLHDLHGVGMVTGGTKDCNLLIHIVMH